MNNLDDFLFYDTHLLNKDDYSVYVLFCDKKIVYIGSSWDYKSRIQNHKKDKVFDSYLIIKVGDGQLAQYLEYDMILALLPKYNKQFNSYSKDDLFNLRQNNKQKWDWWLDNCQGEEMPNIIDCPKEITESNKSYSKNNPKIKINKSGLPYEL